MKSYETIEGKEKKRNRKRLGRQKTGKDKEKIDEEKIWVGKERREKE